MSQAQAQSANKATISAISLMCHLTDTFFHTSGEHERTWINADRESGQRNANESDHSQAQKNKAPVREATEATAVQDWQEIFTCCKKQE
jgi:hypothetical protein